MENQERAIEHDGLSFRSKTEIRVCEDPQEVLGLFLGRRNRRSWWQEVHGWPRRELREPDFVVC